MIVAVMYATSVVAKRKNDQEKIRLARESNP